jgi:hypothetical protein
MSYYKRWTFTAFPPIILESEGPTPKAVPGGGRKTRSFPIYQATTPNGGHTPSLPTAHVRRRPTADADAAAGSERHHVRQYPVAGNPAVQLDSPKGNRDIRYALVDRTHLACRATPITPESWSHPPSNPSVAHPGTRFFNQQRGCHRQRFYETGSQSSSLAPNGPNGPAIGTPHRTRRSRPVVGHSGICSAVNDAPVLDRSARFRCGQRTVACHVSHPTVLCNRVSVNSAQWAGCSQRSDRTGCRDKQRHSHALGSRDVATATIRRAVENARPAFA